MHKLFKEAITSIRMPRRLNVTEWATRYRYLPPTASESGKYRPDRFAFQKEIQDSMGDRKVETVVVMSSTQVGKSEMINNYLGREAYTEGNRNSILFLLPDWKQAHSYSSKRISSLIFYTPVIKKLIVKNTSESDDELVSSKLFKVFENGTNIKIAAAGSPNSVSSDPVPTVIIDEVDRVPDLKNEGDVISLAFQRQDTFYNKKRILTSTPTIDGESKIQEYYNQSDQRKLYVEFKCGHEQVLNFKQIIIPDKEDLKKCYYQCKECEEKYSDYEINNAVKKGSWKPTAKSTTRGYHIWALYSPHVKMEQIAKKYLEALKDHLKLQVFVNTTLGEVWERPNMKIVDNVLFERRESYQGLGHSVPEDALCLTASVDIQSGKNSRFEILVVGWGFNHESWIIGHKVIKGNLDKEETWEKLQNFLLNSRFRTMSGREQKIICTLIDSGGHYTNKTYRFCSNLEQFRIYPSRGASNPQSELFKKSVVPRTRSPLVLVGTNQAKDLLFIRLTLTEFGPGYIHFPVATFANEEFFKQLCSEKQTTGYHKGRRINKYTKLRARNEILDLMVLNIAAVELLNPDYESFIRLYESQNRTVKKEEEKPTKKYKVRRYGGSY